MIGRSCTKCRKSFLLTPLREGRRTRMDTGFSISIISTHAPAGGATRHCLCRRQLLLQFLLTPLREGRHLRVRMMPTIRVFLLTPLREGRHGRARKCVQIFADFYSRPCGRGDAHAPSAISMAFVFLLTPLREGRRDALREKKRWISVFLLTPLREGRRRAGRQTPVWYRFLLTPLREGRQGKA